MGNSKGKRRVYTAEFKREAVALVEARKGQENVEEVARNLGVSRGSLHRWIAEGSEKGSLAFPGHGNQALSPEQAEIQRLRKEVEQLKEEREILKKATAFFAKENR